MIDGFSTIAAWTAASRPLELLILVLPAAVLLTLIAIVWRRWRRARLRATATAGTIVSAYQTTDQHPVGIETPSDLDDDDSLPGQPPMRSDAAIPSLKTTDAPSVAPVSSTQAPSETDCTDLEARLHSAEAEGPEAAIAPIYMQLAEHWRLKGDDTAATEAVRKAAGYGALHGPPAVHAAARLELAERALAAGDLITACEHWQMARVAFEADGSDGGRADVEARMKKHRCPTDWVLNDF